MPNQTLPEAQTETADNKLVWALQDRIEAGPLTPEVTKAVSRLVACIGARRHGNARYQ